MFFNLKNGFRAKILFYEGIFTLKLTYKHEWEISDLIMVDNRRFMHGRTALNKKNKRDILNIQTLESNF